MTVLTLHILIAVPWSNLNRDDTGTPKRTRLGGVQRAMLSSQSLKRAARVQFENESMAAGLADPSVRSVNLAAMVADRALAIAPDADVKKVHADARKLIGTLTKASDPKAGDAEEEAAKDSNRSAWLSAEELETAAQRIAQKNIDAEKAEADDLVEPGRTGSLAIAAFGRMFANSPASTTEAAVAVGPAITTHEAEIEIDYFSTVDDAPSTGQGKGASYLGLAQFTSGVFYRSVTIDRDELKRNWTGIDSEAAPELLSMMVKALIRALPRGKKNATAPYTLPLLVLAEEQKYRTAYDFEAPVAQGSASVDGGFGAASIERLALQRRAAMGFDPENFPGTAHLSGVAVDDSLDLAGDVEKENLNELVEHVVEWIRS